MHDLLPPSDHACRARRGAASRARLGGLLLAAAAAVMAISGCNVIGFVGHGLAGGEKKVNVKAQYRGLSHKKVAVIVAADEYILFEYPDAQLAVSRAVSSKIAEHVEGVKVMSPKQIVDYQHDNPYWSASPRHKVLDKLHVNRLVVIDLSEYRTHAPGNAHVWQGLITGEVGVVEAESSDPDNFAFQSLIRAKFPPNSDLGLVNTDEQTVELGMLQLFARNAAGLFYDHQVTVGK